ncbi:MAG: serine hydrolase [Pseudomonadota bacterium]
MRLALAHGTFSAKFLATTLALSVCLSAGSADAKPKKQTKAKPAATRTVVADSGWLRGQSAIIIDANTGRVLYEQNADTPLHPASVTKVMTLYMLFEQLEAGRLRLDSPLTVSAFAASQSPSKLGLRPGATIEVEDAIKALVTRSANDIAVVIAESIGGSESNFAGMMTRRAKTLGMDNTQFRNASGLPNKGQITTARDLATLGIAIQDRFPKYYKYFSTRTFYYRGQAIANHNRMFGRIEGVDGIKTGYTNASGFNLLTSVHTDDKFIIGVVMGGASAASRDTRMANLITGNVERAYAGRRTAPRATEVATAQASLPAPLPAPAPERAPSAAVAPLPTPQRLAYAPDPVTTAAIPARPAPGSNEPIKPTAVKVTTIAKPVMQAVPAPTFSSGPTPPVAVAQPHAPAPVAAPIPPAVAQAAPLQDTRTAPLAGSAPVMAALPAGQLLPPLPTPTQQPIRTASAGPVALPVSLPPAPPSMARPATKPEVASHKPGWMIQIGAFGGEREAKSRLDQAQSKAKSALAGAEPFVEPASKGSGTFYRARFAGLSEKDAKEACRLLQRNDFDCMTIRN